MKIPSLLNTVDSFELDLPYAKHGSILNIAIANIGEDIKFEAGWDDTDNNNHGNYNEVSVRSKIAEYSVDLNKMIKQCTFTVKKGCHQKSDPHFTLHLNCKNRIPKSLLNNPYAQSGGHTYHIPC